MLRRLSLRAIKAGAPATRLGLSLRSRAMSYKSIIAVASGGPDDAQLLNAAARLASRCAARVRVLPG